MADNSNRSDVFRFVSLRPANLVSVGQLERAITLNPPAVKAVASSEAKAQSARGSNALSQYKQQVREARALLRSARALHSLAQMQTPIAAFSAFLASKADLAQPAEIKKWLVQETGGDAVLLVNKPNFTADWSRVGDNLIALLLAPEYATFEPGETFQQRIAHLMRGLRCFGLLDLIAKKPNLVDTAEEIRLTVQIGIVLLPPNFPRRQSNLARPPAVADLQVVRLEPPTYEIGEIAHIENVMGGEERSREHNRLQESELTVTTDTETIEEKTRDLQTTDRTELQTESQRQLSESVKVNADVEVSASYGPTVSVKADAGFAYESSRQESNRVAATFANEIVKRSVEKVSQRVRETRVARTLTRTEERNLHGFKNETAKPIVGVYRWVNKRQRAFLDTYGKRLMLEYLVPEPAALLRWSLGGVRSGQIASIQAPPKFVMPPPLNYPVTPTAIGETAWHTLAALFSATGVKPPPPPEVWVGTNFKEDAKDPKAEVRQQFETSKELQTPDGYVAKSWRAIVLCRPIPPVQDAHPQYNFRTDLAVGPMTKFNTATNLMAWTPEDTFSSPQPSGILPISFASSDIYGYAVTVEVLCQRTRSHFERWQSEVFEALKAGHDRLTAEYEAKVAAAQFGSPVWGSNPLINRQTERRELKRSVIQMMMGHEFDQAPLDKNAEPIGAKPDERPFLDLAVARAEAQLIQFLEQAFEWSQMSYSLYPYYWSEKGKWKADSVLVDDADPQFGAFLASGAARVAVPVRPGFEGAVALYQATGVVWLGGEPPTPADTTYVSVAQENLESLGLREKPLASIELDNVVTPTNLVILQDGTDLN